MRRSSLRSRILVAVNAPSQSLSCSFWLTMDISQYYHKQNNAPSVYLCLHTSLVDAIYNQSNLSHHPWMHISISCALTFPAGSGGGGGNRRCSCRARASLLGMSGTSKRKPRFRASLAASISNDDIPAATRALAYFRDTMLLKTPSAPSSRDRSATSFASSDF